MKKLLIFCFMLLVNNYAVAQLIYSENGRNVSLDRIEPIKFQKNATDTILGFNMKEGKIPKTIMYFETIGATGLGFSINYRRSIPLSEKVKFNTNGGAGIIFYSFSQKPDLVIPVSLSFSFGKKNAFETGVGFSYLCFENIMAPNVLLGFTRQKGNFFLWIGVVNLLFIENGNNDIRFIPAPGFRFGWVL